MAIDGSEIFRYGRRLMLDADAYDVTRIVCGHSSNAVSVRLNVPRRIGMKNYPVLDRLMRH